MLSDQDRTTLLEVAERSIREGLHQDHALEVDLREYPAHLQLQAATFVTLQQGRGLRGCIGVLEPQRPLVADVAHNAHAAAFSDPRFPPLQTWELDGLSLHISVLSAPELLAFASERELLGQLRPGRDGLILQEGFRKGTFLPSVWESLPDPEAFLRHLKLKAGLTAHHWSDTIKASRYTTESFGALIGPNGRPAGA